jgi:hypothetical protein
MNNDPQPSATSLPLDLSADERRALIQLLRHTIDGDRYPLSPRPAPLRAILAKLDRPAPRPELPPSPSAMNADRGSPMTVG